MSLLCQLQVAGPLILNETACYFSIFVTLFKLEIKTKIKNNNKTEDWLSQIMFIINNKNIE